MMVAGSILFGFYAAVAAVVMAMFGTGTSVLALLLVGSLAFVGFQYKFGKWMAIRSVGAEDMPEQSQGRYDYSRIHQSTEQLCREMDIEKPRLMVAEMGVPNAFAVGRKGSGTVVISKEIIQLLDHDELEGVIAHELSHIKNRDVVIMVLGQSIASMVGIIAQWAVILGGERNIGTYIFAMFVGTIAQMIVMIFVMAISRYREYVADEDAATYTRNPDAMARALEKISSGAQGREMKGEETVNALCIFGSSGSTLQKIFSTHPPTEKRIERLRSQTVGY
ncbi:M48 family metalloprotease [Halovenus sp. WSH3]|uniref:Protease HtpX homolog n=2 Tax=Halovenus carboxidivorans TaxID=2692199 RepID=A0A6B0TAT2_9EURY|nr:M48 family metalloprotease [Halovenus carboxidivorans]